MVHEVPGQAAFFSELRESIKPEGKWVFSEAACFFIKVNEEAQHYNSRLVSKHGKGNALSILAHKIGGAVYFMLKRKEPFSMDTSFAHA